MKNTLYTGDNLFILTGMNSGSVDLIYLDPPFNSKRMYSAPIGSKAAGTSFKDMWTWQDVNEAYLEALVDNYPALVRYISSIGEIHSDAMMAYIAYMTQRIIEMHRVLKRTGSLYLHCDATASHYLKIVLDEVFGRNNFRNEIVWCYKKLPNKAKCFQRNKDTLLFYSKTKNYFFSRQYSEPTEESLKTFETGKRQGYNANHSKKMVTVFDWNKYHQAIHDGKIPPDLKPVEFSGGNPLMRDYWTDIKIIGGSRNKERTGYPTQKPLALLERIIKASSNEGDIVLDPFCGCATTCVKAQQLNRKWIGIDIEEQAVGILKERLKDDAGLFEDFAHTNKAPIRTDVESIKPNKKVKERLYKQQGRRCAGCHRHFELFDFEIDHIIPNAKGGGDYYENYQLLCSSCNRIKGNRPMEYLTMKVREREKKMKEQQERKHARALGGFRF